MHVSRSLKLCAGAATKSRLELIKAVAVQLLQELKSKAETTYGDMNDWLGAKFLQEMQRYSML